MLYIYRALVLHLTFCTSAGSTNILGVQLPASCHEPDSTTFCPSPLVLRTKPSPQGVTHFMPPTAAAADLSVSTEIWDGARNSVGLHLYASSQQSESSWHATGGEKEGVSSRARWRSEALLFQ